MVFHVVTDSRLSVCVNMLVSVYVVQYKEETRIQCLVVLSNPVLRIT